MTAAPFVADASASASCKSPLFQRALATERLYFELGAEVRKLGPATFAYLPGLCASPAAAVFHRVNPEALKQAGPQWIEQAEMEVTRAGSVFNRIYVDEEDSAADDLLSRCGYERRSELAFVGSTAPEAGDVTIRPIASEADWGRKLNLHLAAAGSPDGHGNSAAAWVDLERRKCAEGMQAFLAERDGEIVGTVCAVWSPSMLRIKNLLVRSDRQRQSIGRAIVASMARLGKSRGIADYCVFAVEGHAGERLYRSLDVVEVGRQVEWSKPLRGLLS